MMRQAPAHRRGMGGRRAAGARRSLPYPWGRAWPGPRARPLSAATPRWDLPDTAPVGEESTGRSAAGLDDVAGQVCEWTATGRTHHGGPFHLLKGASWLHRDPLTHRTAAASWVGDGLHSPLVGFRCACDGTLAPRPVARLVPPDAPHAADRPVSACGSETGALHASYLFSRRPPARSTRTC